MKKYEFKPIIEQRVVQVSCDKCSKEITSSDSGGGINEYSNHFGCNFGYSSKKDGQMWSFDLCDDCSDWLKTQIKITIEE